jgi:hypothetical protein
MLGDPAGCPGRLSGPLPENPLLRSGLALAGANTWLEGGTPPPDAEAGLLTAEDVAGLDLTSTQLVVLSACETGLGEVRTGEGVFGLRRAFMLAGARTLVMSLWKVPDEHTCELMVDFYRRVLAGHGRAESLREAQMAMKAKHADPYYWGAFICQGDPSSLATSEPSSSHGGSSREDSGASRSRKRAWSRLLRYGRMASDPVSRSSHTPAYASRIDIKTGDVFESILNIRYLMQAPIAISSTFAALFIYMFFNYPIAWAILVAIAFVLGTGLLTTKSVLGIHDWKLVLWLTPLIGLAWLFLFWILVKLFGSASQVPL